MSSLLLKLSKMVVVKTDFCYKCKQCERQFLESYQPWYYSKDVKQLCLQMYLNGMSLREIERVTDIYHTTILHWQRIAKLELDRI